MSCIDLTDNAAATLETSLKIDDLYSMSVVDRCYCKHCRSPLKRGRQINSSGRFIGPWTGLVLKQFYFFFLALSSIEHQGEKKNEGEKALVERGAVAQSVERATPGEEAAGSIPVVTARSLLVGSVSV